MSDTIKDKYLRNIAYYDEFLRKLDKVFLYKPKNEEFKMPKKFEIILHTEGSIGWDKVHKCWVQGSFNGEVDKNNDFTKYIGSTLNTEFKQTYTLKNHEEVIVCGNNSNYTSDTLDNQWYSMLLEETDISIYFQLINSRNIPIIASPDDRTKSEVKNAFEGRIAGVPAVITTEMENVQTLDITDPSTIDKISSLDNFHEELIKRWCNKYGIDVETKEKKAQVNSMELDSFGDYNTINFLEAYTSRLDFIKEMSDNGIEIELIRNPIYWDEPTEEDIENGDFELMKEGEESNEKDNNSEGNSEEVEGTEQTSNDDE